MWIKILCIEYILWGMPTIESTFDVANMVKTATVKDVPINNDALLNIQACWIDVWENGICSPNLVVSLISARVPLISTRVSARCQGILLRDDILINLGSSVKVLGVIIDNRQTFTEHISRCCKKAARQLNALLIIAKYLDMKFKKFIFNSLLHHEQFKLLSTSMALCGKVNNKLEQIQERSLQTLSRDTSSDYESLLDTFGTTSLLTSRLKYMTLEALRSVRQGNAACLHDMFHVNEVPYEMPWNKIIQPMIYKYLPIVY